MSTEQNPQVDPKALPTDANNGQDAKSPIGNGGNGRTSSIVGLNEAGRPPIGNGGTDGVPCIIRAGKPPIGNGGKRLDQPSTNGGNGGSGAVAGLPEACRPPIGNGSNGAGGDRSRVNWHGEARLPNGGKRLPVPSTNGKLRFR